MKTERWCLLVIAFNAVAATITIRIAVPRMAAYWFVLDVVLIALACGAGCIIANKFGSNGRTKAVLGVMLSWMLAGTLVTQGVGRLYGTWARGASILGPVLILLSAGLFWRNWFRSGDASDRTDEVTAE